MCAKVVQAVLILVVATGGVAVGAQQAQAAPVASGQITTSANQPTDTPWG